MTPGGHHHGQKEDNPGKQSAPELLVEQEGEKKLKKMIEGTSTTILISVSTKTLTKSASTNRAHLKFSQAYRPARTPPATITRLFRLCDRLQERCEKKKRQIL